MATYRIGIGSFNLKDGAVGIGTESTGLGNLKVEGTIKTTDLDVGVSTFTRYSGFEAEQNNITRNQTLSGEYSTTGDIVVGVGSVLTVGLGSTACIGAVECLSIKNHFSVPVGDTAGRNKSSGYTEGTVRYNKDLGTMEFFNGNEWRQFRYQSGAAGRQVLMGGHDETARTKLIEYFSASTGGSTTNFGELFHNVWTAQGNSNAIRGIHAGGTTPGPTHHNVISYITIASEGDAIDFGDLTQGSSGGITVTSSTRGVFAVGGQGGSYVNSIEYVEIMTLGNSLDFGDYQTARSGNGGGCSNGIRGLFMGGYIAPSLKRISDIDMITIASKGNTKRFGDLTVKAYGRAGFSNSVRGICVGGRGISSDNSIIEFVTIASEGNSIDFGDISYGRRFLGGSATQTTGFIMPGVGDPGSGSDDASFNRIESIKIASGGNAVDFGESVNRRYVRVASDSHGGLGGY